MTTEHSLKRREEQLLGEIEARIVGMQYYEAELEPGEQVSLEREPDNSHDELAIRVENRHFDPVAHLPCRVTTKAPQALPNLAASARSQPLTSPNKNPAPNASPAPKIFWISIGKPATSTAAPSLV